MAGVSAAVSEAPHIVRPVPLTCSALPGLPPAISGIVAPIAGVVLPVPSVDSHQPPTRPSLTITLPSPSSKSSIMGGVPIAVAVLVHEPPPTGAPPAPEPATGAVPAVPTPVPAVPVPEPLVPVPEPPVPVPEPPVPGLLTCPLLPGFVPETLSTPPLVVPVPPL